MEGRFISVRVSRRVQLRDYEPIEVSMEYGRELEEDENYKKALRGLYKNLDILVDDAIANKKAE